MRLLTLVALLLMPVGPSQADEPKVDRSLGKEPAYQGRPEYGLLLFGPEGKTRVWAVRDGDVMYLDRNGNGDLTDDGERLPFKSGLMQEVKIAAGATSYRIMSMSPMTDGYYVRVESGGRLLQYATFQLADRREQAPILHFDGPLVMGLAHIDPKKQPLRRGSKPDEFFVLVSTQGKFGNAGWGPVIDNSQHVPADVHPVAKFQFAAKKAGDPPIKLKAVLEKRC